MTESMRATSTPVEACQVCGHRPLTPVLSLGHVRPGNMMTPIGAPSTEETFYPLDLLRCDRCTLVQLGLEVEPSVLFPPDFPYRTRNTRALVENFQELYIEAKQFLTDNDLVVDIGSNDGTLLRNFKDHGHPVLGIEPSRAAEDAIADGIPSKMAFFGDRLVEEVLEEMGPAKLIVSTNTFAHIKDIVTTLRSVVRLMSSDGIFVTESHYLSNLTRTLQYDTIYHEHLRYYSVGSLSYLLGLGGLEVFRVTKIPTHGGSIRVYAAHPDNYEIETSVTETLREEERDGITDGRALQTFREQIVRSKVKLWALLSSLLDGNAKLYGIGAAVRACTLISYLGLDEDILECVLEVAGSDKIGHYMPGTRIPVLDEKKLIEDQPEYALLLSWHIASHVAESLRRQGYEGRFITPLPQPQILDV